MQLIKRKQHGEIVAGDRIVLEMQTFLAEAPASLKLYRTNMLKYFIHTQIPLRKINGGVLYTDFQNGPRY